MLFYFILFHFFLGGGAYYRNFTVCDFSNPKSQTLPLPFLPFSNENGAKSTPYSD